MKSGQSSYMFCISQGSQWRQDRRYIAAIATLSLYLQTTRSWVSDLRAFLAAFLGLLLFDTFKARPFLTGPSFDSYSWCSIFLFS